MCHPGSQESAVVASTLILDKVFPDEFHLQTLERFLTTVEQLQGDVDVTAVISSLIERLSNYARQSSNLLPSNVAVFEIFFKHSTALIDVCSIACCLISKKL